MPDLTLTLPVTDSTVRQFDALTLSERDLLLATQAEYLMRTLRTHTQRKSPGRKPSIPPDMNPVSITIDRISDQTRFRIRDISHRTNQAPTHTVRIAVCDFLCLPKDHPDRRDRPQLRVWPTQDNRQYVPPTYNVTFYDGDRVRRDFSGSAVRQKFRDFLDRWTDDQLSTLERLGVGSIHVEPDHDSAPDTPAEDNE